MNVLRQYWIGYAQMRKYRDDYIDGWLGAFMLWYEASYDTTVVGKTPDDYSRFNADLGFRKVTDALDEGVDRRKSDEWTRGYTDALMLFREAKGLSSKST